MFPLNYAVLVVGDPSAGMFEFCCYLGSTYLDNGERVVFLEANTSPDQVRQQMKEYGVDAFEYEIDGRLVLIDCYTPSSSRDYDPSVLRATNLNLEEVMQRVLEGIDRVGGPPVRVLFDSLTPFHMNYDSRVVGKFFTDLATRVKANGAMTCAIHRGILHEDQIEYLSSLADGVIEMMVDHEFKRYVRIKRFRGLDVTPRWVPFEFEPSEGTEDGAFLSWDRD